MPRYRVSAHESNVLLTDFLTRKIPLAPPAYLRRLIKNKKIKNSQGPLPASHRTIAGEILELPDSRRLLDFLSQQPFGLSILYESREVLIIDKPAGIAVHGSRGHEQQNLTALAEAWTKNRGDNFKIAPVHRLDLETSGPVLFGKGRKSCSELGKLFMRGEVKKYYLALVAGRVIGKSELIAELTAKNKRKRAETSYIPLTASDTASLLDIELHTGRQHQIRRQLAASGHPLFGDRRYRGPCPEELNRLFLHCRELAFSDPFSGQPIDIVSPLPDQLTNYLRHLGLEPASLVP
jgi:RluA family pseudouridine synthase